MITSKQVLKDVMSKKYGKLVRHNKELGSFEVVLHNDEPKKEVTFYNLIFFVNGENRYDLIHHVMTTFNLSEKEADEIIFSHEFDELLLQLIYPFDEDYIYDNYLTYHHEASEESRKILDELFDKAQRIMSEWE